MSTADFAMEIMGSFRYYYSAARHSPPKRRGTMAEVFGADGRRSSISGPGFSATTPVLRSLSPGPLASPDEHIPLTTMNSVGYQSSPNLMKEMER